MGRILTLVVLGLMVCFAGTAARAAIIDFAASADDFVELTIDGSLVATVDTYSGGDAFVTLDLAPGLHDIELNYKNRWGSSWLALFWKDPAESSYAIIPEANLFSEDALGNQINGLLAEYSTGLVIYGEGPIDHNHRNRYEGVNGAPWGGFVSTWTLFEERLSGQLLVEGEVIPEPSSVVTWITLSLCGLAFAWRRRKRAV